jgi:hypothetical protein
VSDFFSIPVPFTVFKESYIYHGYYWANASRHKTGDTTAPAGRTYFCALFSSHRKSSRTSMRLRVTGYPPRRVRLGIITFTPRSTLRQVADSCQDREDAG